MDISRIREDIPLAERYNYLNSAAVGIIPKSNLEALNKFSQRRILEIPYPDLYHNEYLKLAEETRELFATLINAEKDEISFQPNTSMGINLIVEMLEWRRGDNVIVTDLGYPSGVYPWLRLEKRGIATKILENREGQIDVSDFEEAIDQNTRVISVSFVSFANGFRHDLEALGKLAKQNNILLVVDAIQGLGYLDLDVRRCRIDFLTSGNYKWLMAPFGAAEFYCCKRLLEELESPHVGWFSARDPFDLALSPYERSRTARMFEPGNPSFLSIFGLRESLKYISRLGMASMRKTIFKLRNTLVEGLQELGTWVPSPSGERHGSAIVFARLPSCVGEKVYAALRKRNIVVSQRGFNGRSGVRIAPSFWNTHEEVEALIDVFRELTSK